MHSSWEVVLLKKVSREDFPEISQIVSAVVEPRPGHSCEEVVERLRHLRAEHIDVITPTHISARATRSAFAEVSSVAYVHEKPVHMLA
jgi:hypothetical protein